MAQNKYNSSKIESAELSTLVSEFLQADHSAKAFSEKAKTAKEKILSFAEIDSSQKCHYDVANKNGRVEYKLTYKTHKVVYDSSALEKIAALKAEIKKLETEFGIDEFWYFGMTEKKTSSES